MYNRGRFFGRPAQWQLERDLSVSEQLTPLPVIVNHSLSKCPVSTSLAQQGLRVRVSNTSAERSVIFPMSKVAFYYLPVTPTLLLHLDNPEQHCRLSQSLTKFTEVHRYCYIILEVSVLCDQTLALLADIQCQYLNARLQVIPTQSPRDTVAAMIDIAKLQSYPLARKMHDRFCLLQDMMLLNEDTFPRLLAQLGLDSHQQQVVQDGIGSLAKLASALPSDLMDCALDEDTALKLYTFFDPANHSAF